MATPSKEGVYTFHGRCIGRQQIGKKCVFLDLVPLSQEEVRQVVDQASSEKNTGAGGEEIAAEPNGGSSIMLVGDHVRRAEPLSVQALMNKSAETSENPALPSEGDSSADASADKEVMSIYATLNAEKSLAQAEFDAFTASQGTPGVISRPRIGDIFSVVAVKPPPRANAAEADGKPGYETSSDKRLQLNARQITLIAQGEAPKPGDFAHKWNEPEKGSRPKRAEGKPRRHQNRFAVFANWCLERYFLSVAPTAGAGPDAVVEGKPEGGRVKRRVVDVAGGGGKLSAAFYTIGQANQQQCHCTIVDPRNSEFSLASNTVEQQSIPQPAAEGESTEVDRTENPAVPTMSKKQAKKLAKRQGPMVPKDCLSAVEAFFDYDAQKDLVHDADLIVGLHCDGAVNEIIRAACAAQKNFVICACCVFPNLYPRQLEDGTKVVERVDLHTWIIEESRRQGFRGELGRTNLPFDGANEIVYGIAAESVKTQRDDSTPEEDCDDCPQKRNRKESS